MKNYFFLKINNVKNHIAKLIELEMKKEIQELPMKSVYSSENVWKPYQNLEIIDELDIFLDTYELLK